MGGRKGAQYSLVALDMSFAGGPLIALLMCGAAFAQLSEGEFDIRLNLTQPALWTIDTAHLGNHQLQLRTDSNNPALEIRPLWSTTDPQSGKKGISNVDSSRLHMYQLISSRDCSEVEIEFEINMPKQYVDEGKMQFVFSLQAGAQGDYLFNGRTFTMADFTDSPDRYKKVRISATDFNEPSEKLRAIERINLLFHRKGSMESAPISIRNLGIQFNSAKIVPPAPEPMVVNPKSFYLFSYDNSNAIGAITARISDEDLDIGRSLDVSQAALQLSPLWAPDRLPPGHTGKVTLVQPLGGIHNFEHFEVQYVLNVPNTYFLEGKLNLYLFVQAGAAGLGRWSGSERKLIAFADKAGQDVVLTLTDEDFRSHGKKRNQIEVVGLQLIPNGTQVVDPITLKSISVSLPSPQKYYFPN